MHTSVEFHCRCRIAREWLRWLIVCLAVCVARSAQHAAAAQLATDDGYRGIWYFNQRTNDEYGYKYSGGFATYPQQHAPIAIYCPQVEKTFFVYGGTTARSAGFIWTRCSASCRFSPTGPNAQFDASMKDC